MASSPTIDIEEFPSSPPVGPPLGRVLHVINGEHYSGAERVQDLLAAKLPGLGFEVALAAVKPRLFPEMRQTRDIPLHDLRMAGRFDLRPAARLARLIREGPFDLVHAHTPRTAMLAALASTASRTPMVYHIHSPASRDSTRRFQNWLNARIERLSLGRASAVIAVSESLRQDTLRQGISDDRVFAVPNGVPRRAVRPPRTEGQQEWTLGTVALFRPRKGTEVLLRALAELRGEGLPVRLRAVGGFETEQHETELQRMASELNVTDAVDWTGFTRDVDEEFRRMDLFVLPSLFGEGLPMVVLEAMANGVPVIASRVEGTPETIRHGQDGLLVDPGDPAALAAAVRDFVHRRVNWIAIHRNVVQRHAEKFSDTAMALGAARVYRRVLGLDDD